MKHPMARRILGWVGCALALAAIGIGIAVSGSPEQVRMQRMDERRTSDLQQIAWMLQEQVNAGHGLPLTLAEPSVSTDPWTGVPYEYRRLDDRSFELCATFSTASIPPAHAVAKPYRTSPVGALGVSPDFSTHAVGRTCFITTTIAPQRLMPILK